MNRGVCLTANSEREEDSFEVMVVVGESTIKWETFDEYLIYQHTLFAQSMHTLYFKDF